MPARTNAFREGMRDILIRVTGRPDAPELENLAPLVAQASRYVVTTSGAGQPARGHFRRPGDRNAIDASGLASWGSERPVTLIWLAMDRGSGRRALIHAASEGEERTRLESNAARRGLPIVWPGAGDDLVRGLQQAWSGDHVPLIDAARRYGADGVLIGRAQPTDTGGFTADWTFTVAGLTARASGDLDAGLQLAADRYAALYVSQGAGQRSEQIVTVKGINSLESYASAMRMLSRLAPVRGVAVDEITPDAVSFLVHVRGDPEALRQAIARDGRLVAVDAPRIYSFAMKVATSRLICVLRIARTVTILCLAGRRALRAPARAVRDAAVVPTCLDGSRETFGLPDRRKILDPLPTISCCDCLHHLAARPRAGLLAWSQSHATSLSASCHAYLRVRPVDGRRRWPPSSTRT